MRNGSSTVRLAVSFLLAGIGWSNAFSQQGTTGELTGTVTMEGAPVPGVSVTASSASLLGRRRTFTAANGGYQLATLPPGSYSVRFELEGLESLQTSARVSLAEVMRADVVMHLASLNEAVTVTASEPLSVSTNFSSGLVEKLPVGRGIREIVLLAPGANTGFRNALVISGAPSWDSLFLVDGVVVNENLSGQPHNLFIEDAIEEVTLLSGAVSSEYGRFTGGVISTLTKSGGNQFGGSLRDSITSPSWTAQTPSSEAAGSKNLNHRYEGTLGGFLLKDRVWFFSAARISRLSEPRFTYLTNIAYNVGTDEKRWEGKLTGQIGAAQRIVVSYLDVALDETNIIDTNAGRVLELASLIPTRSRPAHLFAMNYSGVVSTNTSLEGQYSQKDYALQGDGSRLTDRIAGTFINYRAVRALFNAPARCGICGDDERANQSWVAKASHYRNTSWGNHTLVTGIESFTERRINNGNRSASNFNIQTSQVQRVGTNVYPIFDITTVIGWTPLFVISKGTNLATRSGYVNDRWDFGGRLSVNFGVRYDRNDAKDADGTVVSDDAAFSPRVGATFDLRSNGRNRLSATYGRYTSKMLDGDLTAGSAQQAGVFSQFGWRYRGPTINPIGTPVDQLLSSPEALARLFAWFDSIGGIQNRNQLFSIVYPGYTARFPHSLQSPAMEEFTVGYGTQFFTSGVLRADVIVRDWRNFYAARLDTTTGQRVDPLGNRIDVASIINEDDETKRTYRALQVQGRWRNRRLNLGGGYSWSRLRGNDEGEELTTASASPPRNLPLKLWYPELVGYARRRPVGYLSEDQRHRARLWASYDLPLGGGNINVALLQSFDSGRAYSAVGDIDATGRVTPYQGAPVNPGYTLTQLSSTSYYFGDRGAFRTDDVYSTDLALNFERRIRALRFFIQAEILNAFDQGAVISVDTEVMTRYRNGAASGLIAFNPFTETPVEGVHYRYGPNFGKPTGPESYQTPRTYQLSVGMKF